ncbi:MAG: amino acid adenylation domain-containing protein [Nitrososphaerales archaeon]
MTLPYLLPQLLTASARSSPRNLAVCADGRSLTYAELDALSNQLASVLLSKGVNRGDRIGIYMPLSLASVVSVFAIMKSGACYVPLDPNAPPKRVAYIIRDSKIKILLSNSAKIDGVAAMFPDECPLHTVVLVDYAMPLGHEVSTSLLPTAVTKVNWDEVLGQPTTSVPNDLAIETDTAYILYTSGSTGTPKGVMISHRNSLTFVIWAAEYVGLTPKDRVACHAPLHFDLSTFCIFSSCLAGAATVLIPENMSTFPSQLTTLIKREQITVWYSVPSVLTLLVLYGNLPAHNLSQLRAIIFAGEVFPLKYLRKLMSLVPHSRYLNWYGPTETNVCTSFEVPHLDLESITSVPIGKACTNTEVFALNSEGHKIIAPGETGELYVRGPSLMQGYWGDREKTRKALVQNPFSQDSKELVYRTGDIVTLDKDGNYHYLGREDGMIKTRGYRVEVGEIETVLYGHDAIKEVVVSGVPDEVFGNRIRALVTIHDGMKIDKGDLVAFCRQRLPHYMVPEIIEFREVLPKTSTGKIDRVGIARMTPFT